MPVKQNTLEKWETLLRQEFQFLGLKNSGIISLAMGIFGVYIVVLLAYYTQPNTQPNVDQLLAALIVLGIIASYFLHRSMRVLSLNSAIQLVSVARRDYKAKKSDKVFMHKVETTAVAELRKYVSTRQLVE